MKQPFIEDVDTGKIRLTRDFAEQYREPFARLGIDINTLNTQHLFMQAYRIYFADNMQKHADKFRGEDPLLDETLAGLPGWEDE